MLNLFWCRSVDYLSVHFAPSRSPVAAVTKAYQLPFPSPSTALGYLFNKTTVAQQLDHQLLSPFVLSCLQCIKERGTKKSIWQFVHCFATALSNNLHNKDPKRGKEESTQTFMKRYYYLFVTIFCCVGQFLLTLVFLVLLCLL